MNKGIKVVQLELEGAGPDVALTIPITLHCFVLC